MVCPLPLQMELISAKFFQGGIQTATLKASEVRIQVFDAASIQVPNGTNTALRKFFQNSRPVPAGWLALVQPT